MGLIRESQQVLCETKFREERKESNGQEKRAGKIAGEYLEEEDVTRQSLHGENQEVHQISALHISVISRLLEGLIRNASEGNEKEEEEGE